MASRRWASSAPSSGRLASSRPRSGRGSTRCRRAGRRRHRCASGGGQVDPCVNAQIGLLQVAPSRETTARSAVSSRRAPSVGDRLDGSQRLIVAVAGLQQQCALACCRGHRLARQRKGDLAPRVPAGAGRRLRGRSRRAHPRPACAAGCRRCRAAQLPRGRAGTASSWARRRRLAVPTLAPSGTSSSEEPTPIQASAGSSRGGTAGEHQALGQLRRARPWPSARRSPPRPRAAPAPPHARTEPCPQPPRPKRPRPAHAPQASQRLARPELTPAHCRE